MLKGYAIGAPERDAAVPNVPTAKECGIRGASLVCSLRAERDAAPNLEKLSNALPDSPVRSWRCGLEAPRTCPRRRGSWSHGERPGGGTTNCGLAMATRVTENTK